MFDLSCFTLTPCCDFCKVAKSNKTIGAQLQVMQYLFLIKILCKDTLSLQRQDCWKSERDNKVEKSHTSITKYGKYE